MHTTTNRTVRSTLAYAEMVAYKRRLVETVAADLGNIHGSWPWREVRTSALDTMRLLGHDHQWTADNLALLASCWRTLADDVWSHDEQSFALRFSDMLLAWSVRCGDIGIPIETEETEDEPLTVPTEWPTEVPTEQPVPA